MTPEQLTQVKNNIEEMKKKVIDAVSKIEMDDKGVLKNTFIFFSFSEGQPGMPISPGVDKDLLIAMVEDFTTYLTLQEKENKLYKIQDEKLRNRLLNNLHANIK